MKKDDVRECANGDPSPWRFATRIVTSNKEVNAINKSQVVRFAKACGKPVYFWYCRPTGGDGNSDYEASMANLELNLPETIQYFADGAPCMITKNTYMKHGVANGTAGTMHSLTWADKNYRPPVPKGYMPGQLIRVQQPYSINVELPVHFGLSKAEALRVAKTNGKPVYYWNEIPTGAMPTKRADKSGVVHYFVEGARCKLETRTCTEHGLANDSVATMSSITWENKGAMCQVTRNAIAGELYQVAQPSNIKFDLQSPIVNGVSRTRPRNQPQNAIIVPMHVVVPMVQVSQQFKLSKYNPKTRKPALCLQCYSHNVKLMFAITFHKSQGQTLSRVVLHLHKRPGRSLRNLTIQGLYVALSRVRVGSCIRVSYDTRTGLGHLMRLRRPKNFDLWVNNYDDRTGLWVPAGMNNLREKCVNAARAVLRSAKVLSGLKLAKLVELARVLDVEVTKNAKGAANKPEYVNALYDEWCSERGTKASGKSPNVQSTRSVKAGKRSKSEKSPNVRSTTRVKATKRKLGTSTIVRAHNKIQRAGQKIQDSTSPQLQKAQGTLSSIQHGTSHGPRKRHKLPHDTSHSPRKRHKFESQYTTNMKQKITPTTPTKRVRTGNSAQYSPVRRRKINRNKRTTSTMKRHQNSGYGSKGLGGPSLPMPLPLGNPHICVTGKLVKRVCYINSTLQLLAASTICVECCKRVNGPVPRMLRYLHARDSVGAKTTMDVLISCLPERLFSIGNNGCAMEFMTWCIKELQLNSVSHAVTRTITEQICLTCHATKLTKSGNNGYDDASCEVNLTGDVDDLADEVGKSNAKLCYRVRQQLCWQGNVHTMQVDSARNEVRFRDIHYYGTVVIFRWGNRQQHAVRLKKELGLMTANPTFTKLQCLQYRLRAYTVFFPRYKHYKTFRFENGILYCCDDSHISQVTHDFCKPVGRCVMAIYDRDNSGKNSSAASTSARKLKVSNDGDNSVWNNSPPTLPMSARKLNFVNDGDNAVRNCGPSALPASASKAKLAKCDDYFDKNTWPPTLSTGASKPSLFSRNHSARTSIRVHGDGFCWIYAFLVAIGGLHQEDFPNGDNGFGRAPSKLAIKWSTALAPHAFPPNHRCKMPQFVNGEYSDYGDEGGHTHFHRLFARIRPHFRFFVLDRCRVKIRFAALLKGQHKLPNDIMRLFKPGYGTFDHVLEYHSDANRVKLKMVFSADERNNDGSSIFCQDTDVLVYWVNRKHFNALAPGSAPDRRVTKLLRVLNENPGCVPDMFPLHEWIDDSSSDTDANDSDCIVL